MFQAYHSRCPRLVPLAYKSLSLLTSFFTKVDCISAQYRVAGKYVSAQPTAKFDTRTDFNFYIEIKKNRLSSNRA